MWKTKIQSPVGELRAFASNDGLRGLMWPESDVTRFAVDAEFVEPRNQPIFEKLASQLSEYFAGTRQLFDLPLDPVGTEFQCWAWNALTKIPFGKTRS